MPELHSSPRCSGTRMLRWVTVVVPAAVVLTGSFGTTGAYAAANSSSAAQAASANANHGVGQGNGAGNAKHAEATGTDTPAASSGSADSGASVAATASSTSSASSTSTATSHQVDCTATPTDPRCSVQPLSTADQNSGGANGKCPGGPYCSTRDGSASGNGNGNGKAVGKPCAGCVGKADNKNPKGQYPNGSDHNAGYECDRNHGIGRTNPAHTGCKSTPPPPPVCNAPNTVVNGVCTPPPPVCTAPNTLVNGVCTPPTTACTAPNTVVNGVCTPPTTDCTSNPTAAGCGQSGDGGGDCTTNPTAAGCQSEHGSGCVPTKANGFCSDVLGEKTTRKPTVQGEKAATPPGSLPFTGADVLGLLAAGLVALVAGSGLLLGGSRQRLRHDRP